MDSKALIKETLKYLETNENGQPKYRIDIYKNGIIQSGNRAISMLTSGIVSNAIDEDQNEPTPVSVYTIGDIFNTYQQTSGDILRDIQGLPKTLDDIKVSLKQLGVTTLEKQIDILKSAVAPIEVVQTINDVYRIAKPLVKKVKDIAQIMFYYPAAAEVAQDVLSYLSRLAFATAKNYLNKLFDIFMDTPVFAVYENDDTVNLAGTYSTLSNTANGILDSIIASENAFRNIINYANSADKKTYEPKYSGLGIVIPENKIKDVFHDFNTRKIFIASENKIYSLNEDYSITEIAEVENTINKIYYYKDNIYYIANNNVYRVNHNSSVIIKQNLVNPKLIFSEPLYLCDDNGIYDPSNGVAVEGLTTSNIEYTAFDYDNKILYYTVEHSNHGAAYTNFYKITKIEDGTFSSEHILKLNDRIFGMAYFNNMIYIVKKKNNDYYVSKISAGLSFNETQYSYLNQDVVEENITWTDGSLATNGSYLYEQYNALLRSPKKALGSINCVTKKIYNGRNYYVATGGNKVFVSGVYDNGASWFSKELEKNTIENEGDIPDNIAGCLWFSNPNNYFIAYSQKNIYVVGPEHLGTIFDIPIKNPSEKMQYKKFAEFKDWWENRAEDEPAQVINITKKIPVDDCIITSIKVINNSVYVALFNPVYGSTSSSNIVKTGIYKLVISDNNIGLSLSDPQYVADTSNPKIYSFDYISRNWYYTDGKNLKNITTNSNTFLDLKDDRALAIINKNNTIRILTSQKILDEEVSKEYSEINSAVNYTGENITLASTRNTLMISDNNYIYNIINNSGSAITSEMYQICYEKGANDFDLKQSCDAVFIVSENAIKNVPYYGSLTSSNYGCGYYTDTTLNKWYGAAPYYFVSNVLNNRGKSKLNRNIFIGTFTENFKVELEKLLKNIPDAFIAYITEKLISGLKEVGVDIEGDDGQIANLLIESVASTTANSIGMYIHDKFLEKIGDDNTYNTFAENVYQACIKDDTNNMTDDFYKIFEELYYSIVNEAITTRDFGAGGMSEFLLRYYQNHKAEWAKSMTDLIDIDTVDPDIYEAPLKTTQQLKKTTYRFNYKTGNYEYEYMPSPALKYDTVEGYLNGGEFYDEDGNIIDQKVYDSSSESWSMNDETICYKNPEDNEFYRFKLDDYVLTEDETVVPGTTYYKRIAESQEYVLTQDTQEFEKPYYKAFFSLTNDESVNPEKTYYSKAGGERRYTLIPDTETELDAGTYFEKQDYQLTTDTNVSYTQVNDTKTIYIYDSETLGGYDVLSAEPNENGDYVKNGNIYYYGPTSSEQKYNVEFTESDNGHYYSYDIYAETKVYSKTYYQTTYEQVQVGEQIDPNRQYYRAEYVLTNDTQIDQSKIYYEYIDLSPEEGEYTTYYVYNPETTAQTKYTINFLPVEYIEPNLNQYETYYTYDEEHDEYKVFRGDLDMQYKLYYANSIKEDPNGKYEERTTEHSPVSDPLSGYKQVTYPVVDNIRRYYEIEYIKIKSPENSDIEDGLIFKISFLEVKVPNDTDISTYYEKNPHYVVAQNLHYTQNGKILNDRKLYIMSNTEVSYNIIEFPEGNPKDNGWYEIYSYDQIISGSSIDPNAEGLFERIYSPSDYIKVTSHFRLWDGEIGVTRYDVVFNEDGYGKYIKNSDEKYIYDPSSSQTPKYSVTSSQENINGDYIWISNPKEEGWYTYTKVFSTIYDDKKVYIDLAAQEINSYFPELDNDWHNSFYNSVSDAKESVTDKESALEALNSIVFPIPEWNWKALINESVTTLYIPTQGEQYRTIIRDSNMYPIQWQELPSDINRKSFDYALTTLLYMIKQGLLTNITILVDGGQVKCYSCVDASTVIQKIINRNYVIWRNQIRNAKNKVEKATSLNEIKAAFDMIKSYDETLFLLENILNQQSALYAKYIDMLIEEQVINDNETEVSL